MLEMFKNKKIAVECNGVSEVNEFISIANKNGLTLPKLNSVEFIRGINNGKEICNISDRRVCFAFNEADPSYANVGYSCRKWYENNRGLKIVNLKEFSNKSYCLLEMFKNGRLVIELENENQIGKIICWARGIGITTSLSVGYYNEKLHEYGKIGFRAFNNNLNCTELKWYQDQGYKVVTWTEFTKSLRRFTLSNLLDTHVVIRVFSEEEARKVVSTFIQKDVSSLDYFLLWDALGDNLAFSIVSKDGENILIPHDVSLLVDTITQLTIDEVDFEELKEVSFMDAMCNKEFKVDNSGILYILAQDCIKENINIQNVHVRICDDRFITPSEFMAWLSSIASDEEIKQVIKESKFYVEGC